MKRGIDRGDRISKPWPIGMAEDKAPAAGLPPSGFCH